MPPIANVHRDPAKLGLEHGVAQVSLHVVSGLKKKKITDKELCGWCRGVETLLLSFEAAEVEYLKFTSGSDSVLSSRISGALGHKQNPLGIITKQPPQGESIMAYVFNPPSALWSIT